MKSKKLREGASKYTRFCVSSIATVTHHEPVKRKKQVVGKSETRPLQKSCPPPGGVLFLNKIISRVHVNIT